MDACFVTQILQLEPGSCLDSAVGALLQATEQPDLVRWIEFPSALLLFLLVPGDPMSGAIYVLDRKQGTWYAMDFEDQQFGGYSLEHWERLLGECGFLALIECPGLWRTGLGWQVEPGKRPEVRV